MVSTDTKLTCAPIDSAPKWYRIEWDEGSDVETHDTESCVEWEGKTIELLTVNGYLELRIITTPVCTREGSIVRIDFQAIVREWVRG